MNRGKTAGFALRAKGLGKIYRLYNRPVDRLKELLFRRQHHTNFVALQDISFDLPKGRTLGIVGENGAGKSTLMQCVAGALTPTSGEIERDGVVLGLLELGLGFHIEFTGAQNIFLYGDVLGLPRRFVESKLDEIKAFSELGPFIDRPLKTYSTGMRMRLAFSLVSSLEPEILIIDEALAVGDIHFQKKCIDRMMELRTSGCTIIFCSHSVYQVEMFCDEVIWLKDGSVCMHGDAGEVLTAYDAYQMRKNGEPMRDESKPSGEALVRITELALLSETPIARGDDLRFRLVLESDSEELSYNVSLSIKMEDGRGVYATGTHLANKPPLRGKRREVLVTYPRVPLMGGVYTIHARVFDDQGLMVYHEKVLPGMSVSKDSKEIGVCYLPNHWEIS